MNADVDNASALDRNLRRPDRSIWPIGVTILLGGLAVLAMICLRPSRPAWQTAVPLDRFEANEASTLAEDLAAMGYVWPPDSDIPAVALVSFPEDMGDLSVDAKKTTFFRVLLPLVLAENQRIETQREFVEAQFAKDHLDPSSPDYTRLARLAREYHVDQSLTAPSARAALLRRIDTVPIGLVLTQAAIESGWGTSRFAREANNLFGVWTWNADEGLAPRGDPDGGHYVRVFTSLRASVRDYLFNINVGHAYEKLRRVRANQPDAGGLQLAAALDSYSERGPAYVKDVQGIMRHNDVVGLARKHFRLVQPNNR